MVVVLVVVVVDVVVVVVDVVVVPVVDVVDVVRRRRRGGRCSGRVRGRGTERRQQDGENDEPDPTPHRPSVPIRAAFVEFLQRRAILSLSAGFG